MGIFDRRLYEIGGIMKEIYDFLRRCGCFFLATEEGDQPRVRPFGVIEIYEDKIYFLTGKKKNVAKQIEKNPKVEICAAAQGEVWIRLEGELKADERVEAKKFFLDRNPQLRGMYNENDDNTLLLYMEHGKATISSFVNAPKEIRF